LNEEIPYQPAVGTLNYLANCTRPDIAYAVNALSRKQSDYNLSDWVEVERVMKYLSGARDLGLIYTGHEDSVVGYSDASLGVNDPEGFSTSGSVIKLFGDIVSWGSKRQNIVATSSMEAEYVAMCRTSKLLIYLSAFCNTLLKTSYVPILYEDNRAAIGAAKAEVAKTLKHLVKLNYHFVRKALQNDELKVIWISTHDQLADSLTKALPRPKFEDFRNGLVNL